ncbi:MAG TPA: beta-ketoacyl-ACP synthase II [Blattabacteriaceae bacterium]
MPHLKRVVVTGLGILSPIGNNVEDFWFSLVKGENGVDLIKYFDTSNLKTRFACSIKGYFPENFFSKKEIRKLDSCTQYGIIASEEAIKDSGLDFSKENRERIGVIWGSGMGTSSECHLLKNGLYSPFFIPKTMKDITSIFLSIKHGLLGPSYATVSSCTSSANALFHAFNILQLGKTDVIITGGSESAITETCIGGFNALNAISTKNEKHKSASRPFDKKRDGFVLGEGAGSLVLEEYEHAKSRNSKIYAEIAGMGISSDAHHITAPHPLSLGIIHAIKNAIDDAKIKPSEVEHINAHGPSTYLGDLSEIRAIKDVFGKSVFNININSTKSMTGHLLGASGAIESVASILPLSKGIIPPTINLSEIDEEIDTRLNLTPKKAQKRTLNISLCNNFGFGGHNVCIIFKKYDRL